MADKTIPNLQLISSVTSGLSFPVDNATQTYRATASQVKDFVLGAGNVPLTALADNIFTGLTAVTPAGDDYLIAVDTSDVNKTKKILASSYVQAAYRSVTTTGTVTTSDSTLKLSGASFTLTLPTAVGVSGKSYKILHQGTSFTQVYTLATTSSQTIGGIASGAYALYTNGEAIELESDGANWIIIGRSTKYYARQSGITINGVTTPPTKPTVRTYDYVDMWREGKYATFDFRYYAPTVAGSAAGTGFYKVALPFSLQMDTAIQPNCGGAPVDDTLTVSFHIPGSTANFRTNSGPTGAWLLYCPAVSSTEFSIFKWRTTGVGNFWGPTSFALTDVIGGAFSVRVPINGWQP